MFGFTLFGVSFGFLQAEDAAIAEDAWTMRLTWAGRPAPGPEGTPAPRIFAQLEAQVATAAAGRVTGVQPVLAATAEEPVVLPAAVASFRDIIGQLQRELTALDSAISVAAFGQLGSPRLRRGLANVLGALGVHLTDRRGKSGGHYL